MKCLYLYLYEEDFQSILKTFLACFFLLNVFKMCLFFLENLVNVLLIISAVRKFYCFILCNFFNFLVFLMYCCYTGTLLTQQLCISIFLKMVY